MTTMNQQIEKIKGWMEAVEHFLPNKKGALHPITLILIVVIIMIIIIESFEKPLIS